MSSFHIWKIQDNKKSMFLNGSIFEGFLKLLKTKVVLFIIIIEIKTCLLGNIFTIKGDF